MILYIQMTFGSLHPERYGEVTKDEAFAIMDHFYKSGGRGCFHSAERRRH